VPATAQNKKIYKVNPGERVYDVIPKNDMYKYPGFRQGIVLLKDGTYGSAKLNYNSLFAEMQFIDPKGDTLSLADENNIISIAVKKDTFYYDNGYLELVAGYNKIKLARRRIIDFSNREKIGALDIANAGEIETYTTVTSRTYMKDLIAKEVLIFSERTIYYFGDRFNHFMVANKKNLLKMFSNQQRKVSDYLENNPVNFNDEKDLVRLGSFLQEL
jgi:hypothetical protein